MAMLLILVRRDESMEVRLGFIESLVNFRDTLGIVMEVVELMCRQNAAPMQRRIIWNSNGGEFLYSQLNAIANLVTHLE